MQTGTEMFVQYIHKGNSNVCSIHTQGEQQCLFNTYTRETVMFVQYIHKGTAMFVQYIHKGTAMFVQYIHKGTAMFVQYIHKGKSNVYIVCVFV